MKKILKVVGKLFTVPLIFMLLGIFLISDFISEEDIKNVYYDL